MRTMGNSDNDNDDDDDRYLKHSQWVQVGVGNIEIQNSGSTEINDGWFETADSSGCCKLDAKWTERAEDGRGNEKEIAHKPTQSLNENVVRLYAWEVDGGRGCVQSGKKLASGKHTLCVLTGNNFHCCQQKKKLHRQIQGTTSSVREMDFMLN